MSETANENTKSLVQQMTKLLIIQNNAQSNGLIKDPLY